MPRVGQGKQTFRIIYFFLCKMCRENLFAFSAYMEGMVGPNDPAVQFLTGGLPNRAKKPKVVGDILKTLCGRCKRLTVDGVVNLEGLGKKITVPDFKGLLALENLVQDLYGGLAVRMGVPETQVRETAHDTFFGDNVLHERGQTLWSRMIAEHPEPVPGVRPAFTEPYGAGQSSLLIGKRWRIPHPPLVANLENGFRATTALASHSLECIGRDSPLLGTRPPVPQWRGIPLPPYFFIVGAMLLPSLAGAAPDTPSTKADLRVVTGARFSFDLKYNTENNFLKRNVYKEFGIDQCMVRPELLEKLNKLTLPLEKARMKVVFYDCTRPLEVQRAMWKIVPDSRYVANPKSGSNHNRGTAIDVGLANDDGSLIAMPSEFDEFSPKSAASFSCAPEDAQKCRNRETLKKLMADIGLVGISTEWWHFQLPNAKTFPLVDSFNAHNAQSH